MSNYLSRITKYFLLYTLISTPLFAIKIETPYHAVDIAGKQRMFTQRMLKDYAMIGMHNSFANPDEDLNSTIHDFEEHLYSLHDYTKSKEIKKSAKRVEKLWLPIKKVLEEEPTKDKVTNLQESLELLLDASDKITELFAKETKKISGEIVNISGRQRMLSQRMAGLYMLKSWGVKDVKFKDKMESTMKLFKTSLERLKKDKLNTDEIDKLLLEVEKSFMFFEVMNRSESTFIPTLIYKKSNDILKNMNKVTACYVEECK